MRSEEMQREDQRVKGGREKDLQSHESEIGMGDG